MSSNAVTLGDLYAQCLKRNGEAVAIIDGETQLTYFQLAERVGRIIGLFDELGLSIGDRIGLAARMSADFIACYMACHIAGIAVADMPPSMPADNLVHRVRSAGLTMVILEPAGIGGDVLAFAGTLTVPVLTTTPIDGLVCVNDAIKLIEPATLFARPAPRCAAITYTGGSTGLSKAIAYDGAAGASIVLAHMAALPYPPHPISVVCRTSFPVMAYNVQPTLLRGGTLVTQADFDIDELYRLTVQHKANLLFMATQAIYTLVGRDDLVWPTGQLKLLFYGGEAINPSRLSIIVERLGPVLVGSYGCSEATSTVLLLPEDHDLSRPERISSLGRALLGVDIEMRDPQGNAVPAGDYGEITIRSPSHMLHYIGDPEKTAEVMTDHWVRTGDVGRMDDQGYIYILDRLAFSFEARGRAIYPRAIDLLLGDHPEVQSVATIGIPDPELSNRICANVVRRNGSAISADELRSFARQGDPRMEIDHILFMDDLPKNPSNLKVDRRRLTELVLEHLAGEG
ncbi:MAG: putative fatty-acid-CoA ligase [Sphingomonas bacterium]|uniref:class I adenylate-forming enzyme family protein n=1 Tax=Sphingomonas bacterium TaxID=1895847 RepID=UPI0026369E51|nr:AMP-binding protein [Sphingomonas bacterium]MDB5703861.1 putative fatty-acid-CoA ligase [Sphingomonas bacterium]